MSEVVIEGLCDYDQKKWGNGVIGYRAFVKYRLETDDDKFTGIIEISDQDSPYHGKRIHLIDATIKSR